LERLTWRGSPDRQRERAETGGGGLGSQGESAPRRSWRAPSAPR